MHTPSRAAMDAAVAHLRRGGVLCYPTETSYAIGCDATHARAVASIFRSKGRASEQSLPLIVPTRAMAERYARFTPLARRLARQYWPGPLTLVLHGHRRLPRGITASNHTRALRVPAHPIARALARRLGRPIVSTSANRSGASPARSAAAARRAFPSSSCMILDGGVLRPRRPSTIVDARARDPHILRQGMLRLP